MDKIRNNHNHIPVIDLTNYFSQEKVAPVETHSFLDFLKRSGCVILKNHGINQAKIDAVFDESKAFFKKTDKEKMAFGFNQDTLHGYAVHKVDGSDVKLRESFNLRFLPESEIEDSSFLTSLTELAKECNKLTRKLLSLIMFELQDDPDFSVESLYSKPFTEDNYTSLKTLFYPSLGKKHAIGNRLKEHTDYGMITLLFQDQIGGLKVFDQEIQSWIPVKPVRNTIFLNVGDMLERLTGGVVPAALHKVETVQEERQSVAFFGHFDNDCLISPLHDTTGEAHAKNAGKTFEPMFTSEHVKTRRLESTASKY